MIIIIIKTLNIDTIILCVGLFVVENNAKENKTKQNKKRHLYHLTNIFFKYFDIICHQDKQQYN